MDENSIILISVFCGFSTLCLCCIFTKAIQEKASERSRLRLRETIRNARNRLRYTLLVVAEDYTNTEETMEDLKDEYENLRDAELIEVV